MSSYHSPFARRKVKPRVEPALVGIGLVLAGAPAMPALTEVMGEVALQQGRVDDDGVNLRSVEVDDDLAPDIPADTDSGEDDDNPFDLKPEDENTGELEVPAASDPEKDTPAWSIPCRRRTIVAAQTSPALVHLRNLHRSRLSEDPLDQQDPPPGRVSSPYQSSPSISSSPSPLKQNVVATADALLQRYDLQSQSHLLRSQYCRSEVCVFYCMPRHDLGAYVHSGTPCSVQVQFLLTLESISNRVLVVPKPARVSALRAELTALNHQLPAEVRGFRAFCINLLIQHPSIGLHADVVFFFGYL